MCLPVWWKNDNATSNSKREDDESDEEEIKQTSKKDFLEALDVKESCPSQK